MTGMVRDLTPNAKRMKAAAGAGYATATDLADWLARALKMPFREAHHLTGRIVAIADARGEALEKLTLDELRSVEPRIIDEAFGVLGAHRSEILAPIACALPDLPCSTCRITPSLSLRRP
jgi:argininosuccinate lyase